MTKKTHSRQGQQAPLSLESFAQRKGQVRAFEEFHKRKNLKRVQTAKALRGYRTAMKQEGFDAGKGASRKRCPISEVVPPKMGHADARDASEDPETKTPKVVKKKKMNPFQKSLQKAERRNKDFEQLKTDKIRREIDRKQRLKDRKIQSRLLVKRTRRGQPIMKNLAENLLVKLRKQVG